VEGDLSSEPPCGELARVGATAVAQLEQGRGRSWVVGASFLLDACKANRHNFRIGGSPGTCGRRFLSGIHPGYPCKEG
jgi:hypothetical protein